MICAKLDRGGSEQQRARITSTSILCSDDFLHKTAWLQREEQCHGP
jgi:hypothetical protein